MNRLTFAESGLTRAEYDALKKLTTPAKIQDFLDTTPFNFEKEGDSHMSPRRVLSARRAHCIEGAMLAAAALWIAGEPPLVMNLSPRMGKGDFDHVIALFKRGGYWGAISKTNHSVLRYRDPIYRTPRELALSYFHEWFIPKTTKATKGGSPSARKALKGEKVLECYSRPLDLRRFGTDWITSEKDTWHISDALSEARHYYFVPKSLWRHIRPTGAFELMATDTPEWSTSFGSHTRNRGSRK